MEKDYLIEKWLKAELTPQEQEAFDQMEGAPFYKDVVAAARAFKAPAFDTETHYEAFRTQQKAKPQPKVRKLWPNMLRIASVLVIGLLITVFYTRNRATDVLTLAGEKTEIRLPDESYVRLNAASELSYRKSGWEDRREVHLEGEAYFKVAKGSRFDVQTPDGVVSVLGTEFNVRQRNGLFEVYCYEGRVAVQRGDASYDVPAGTYVRVVDGAVFTGGHQAPEPGWTSNFSEFERIPILKVLDELERQYRITITSAGIDQDRLFTGSFPHDNLDKALEAVTAPMGYQYQRIGAEEVIINTGE